ncbi:hypothetical protein D3C80_736350 [compost metagenome]
MVRFIAVTAICPPCAMVWELVWNSAVPPVMISTRDISLRSGSIWLSRLMPWLFSRLGTPGALADSASRESRWALVAVASLSNSGRIRVRLSPVRVTLD